MNKPIGIYVRVSRKGDREDERFHSPREQADRAAALARAKGYAVGPTFEDIDVSGGKSPADRPAMGRLLAAIDAGELGGIAAFSLDRLSRDPAHGDALVKRVTKAGGVLLTPDMPDAIDTPTGEFTFGMLLQVAKLYRSQSRARFASAKERAIVAGIPVHKVPVGYRQRPDRRMEVDPDVAPYVRRAFERRAAGAGWTEVVNILEEGTGRTWTLGGARSVIRNRFYATGIAEHSGFVSEWEAGTIVDEPLWHAAQTPTGLRHKRNPGSHWILPGLIRCASCGNAMGVWTGASRRRDNGGPWIEIPHEKRARRYRCRNRSCPEQGTVDANRIEPFVVHHTLAEYDEIVSRSDTPDLGALEEALAASERRLAQALSPEAQDALGDAWASTVKARRKERDADATALGEAQREAGADVIRDLHLREVWDDLSEADQRSALSLFWKAIYVGKKERPKSRGGVPIRFVARGPIAEAELTLPGQTKAP